VTDRIEQKSPKIADLAERNEEQDSKICEAASKSRYPPGRTRQPAVPRTSIASVTMVSGNPTRRYFLKLISIRSLLAFSITIRFASEPPTVRFPANVLHGF